MRIELRSPERYRLRVYVDALRQAESTSDVEWVENWVRHAGPDSIWVPRQSWITYLKECIVAETTNELTKEAA